MFSQSGTPALTLIIKTNRINDIIYHFHTLAARGPTLVLSLMVQRTNFMGLFTVVLITACHVLLEEPTHPISALTVNQVCAV